MHAYNSDVPISDIMWRLRLQHVRTLGHYLQEVATASSLRTLDESARRRITDAAALYIPFLVAVGRP